MRKDEGPLRKPCSIINHSPHRVLCVQTAVLPNGKNTEMKETGCGPCLQGASGRGNARTTRPRGLLDGSAKEVQPHPCLCRVLHWTQPTHFKRIRSEFLVITCTKNWVSCLPVCLDVQMFTFQPKTNCDSLPFLLLL